MRGDFLALYNVLSPVFQVNVTTRLNFLSVISLIENFAIASFAANSFSCCSSMDPIRFAPLCSEAPMLAFQQAFGSLYPTKRSGRTPLTAAALSLNLLVQMRPPRYS